MKGKKQKREWITGEYWAVYSYGGNLTICEKAKTAVGARRKASSCERFGGAPHRILYVQEVSR